MLLSMQQDHTSITHFDVFGQLKFFCCFCNGTAALPHTWGRLKNVLGCRRPSESCMYSLSRASGRQSQQRPPTGQSCLSAAGRDNFLTANSGENEQTRACNTAATALSLGYAFCQIRRQVRLTRVIVSFIPPRIFVPAACTTALSARGGLLEVKEPCYATTLMTSYAEIPPCLCWSRVSLAPGNLCPCSYF